MERHRNRHSGLRLFPCPECPKKFTRMQYLKEHKNSHSGDRPQSCKFCSLTFSDHTSRYRHMKSHEEEYQPTRKKVHLIDNRGEITMQKVKEDKNDGSTELEDSDSLCSFLIDGTGVDGAPLVISGKHEADILSALSGLIKDGTILLPNSFGEIVSVENIVKVDDRQASGSVAEDVIQLFEIDQQKSESEEPVTNNESSINELIIYLENVKEDQS